MANRGSAITVASLADTAQELADLAESPLVPLEGLEPLGTGLASWYGPGFHGRRTANGERFDSQGLTAAHRSLPFGTRLCVRSNVTGKTVQVRVNDRGPFSPGREIDLSQGAAQLLGMTGLGIKSVDLWQLTHPQAECSDKIPKQAGRSTQERRGAAAAVRRPVARSAVQSPRAAAKAKAAAPRRR